MRRQLPDRVKLGALLLPLIGDSSAPWVLDACCQFVDPWMQRLALERGWHLVTGDINPTTPAVVKMDFDATLPWDDGQFEAVCCIDTLEHVENYEHAITELARVTRTDGILIFSVPMPGKFPDMRRETRRLQPGEEEHGHRWAFGADIADKIAAAGFRQIGGAYSHDYDIFRLSHLWIMERV